MSSKKSSPWGRNGSGAVVVTRISGRSSGSKTWYFGTNSSREMLRSSRSANLYSLNCHDAVMSRACTISKSILNLPSAFGEKVTAYYKEIYIHDFSQDSKLTLNQQEVSLELDRTNSLHQQLKRCYRHEERRHKGTCGTNAQKIGKLKEIRN